MMTRQPTKTVQISAQHVVLAQAIIDNWDSIGHKCVGVDRLLLDGIGFPDDSNIVLCVTEINHGGERVLYLMIDLKWMYFAAPERLHELVDKVGSLITEVE